jgi:hypothetical protein
MKRGSNPNAPNRGLSTRAGWVSAEEPDVRLKNLSSRIDDMTQPDDPFLTTVAAISMSECNYRSDVFDLFNELEPIKLVPYSIP